jgi:hypothetical protein
MVTIQGYHTSGPHDRAVSLFESVAEQCISDITRITILRIGIVYVNRDDDWVLTILALLSHSCSDSAKRGRERRGVEHDVLHSYSDLLRYNHTMELFPIIHQCIHVSSVLMMIAC